MVWNRWLIDNLSIKESSGCIKGCSNYNTMKLFVLLVSLAIAGKAPHKKQHETKQQSLMADDVVKVFLEM